MLLGSLPVLLRGGVRYLVDIVGLELSCSYGVYRVSTVPKRKIMGTGSLYGIVRCFPEVPLTDCDGNGADVLVSYVFDSKWGFRRAIVIC